MRPRQTEADGLRAAEASTPPQGYWTCTAVVGVIFTAHLAFAANGSALALALAFAEAITLAGILCLRWGREGLQRAHRLLVPGVLFAGVLALALLSLTPMCSESNAPIWAPVGGPASASINHEAVVIEIVKLLGLVCLFLIGFAIGDHRGRAWWTLRSMVAFGAAYAVFSLALHFYSPATLFGYTIWTGPDRLAATLGSANIAGALFGFLLLCSTAVLLQHRRDVGKRSNVGPKQLNLFVRRAPLDTIALALFATCLLMTASRGAVAATASMCVFLLAWETLSAGMSRTGWLTPLLVVCALIGVMAFAGDMVANRYQDSSKAAADRLALFTTHWRAFVQSPVLGSGLGSFRALNAALMTKQNYGALAGIGAAHNIFVQWLEQMGWAGSALMWSCIAWLLARVVIAALYNPPLSVSLRLCVATSGLLILHGLTDFALEVPSVAAMWTLILGIGSGRAR